MNIDTKLYLINRSPRPGGRHVMNGARIEAPVLAQTSCGKNSLRRKKNGQMRKGKTNNEKWREKKSAKA